MSLNTRGEKDNMNGFPTMLQEILSILRGSQGSFQGRSQGMVLGRGQDLYDSWILEF